MKNLLKNSVFLLVMLLIFTACKKEDYMDTGVHNPNYNGTVWQFLESRPDLFDTLTVALKIAKLDDVLKNEEVTFFAPPDPSILKSVWLLNEALFRSGQDSITSLDQIKPEIWRKYLSQYIMKGKYVAKDFTQLDTLKLDSYPGGVFKTIDGKDMNIGVFYNDVKSSDKQVIKYAGYRQLYLNYPYAIPGLEEFLLPFVTAPVATSDIQPTNGVLHVLQFSKHALGFRSYLFAEDAMVQGILPKTDLTEL
ncbi:fasciclin domain-containing protein [Sphingobacterium faecium]|uniref:fasciclin domain-containing protein n=1 Tax=Sphingobacterium faecium TaxID=34087 RepID=UPI002468FCDE|nr:fasciclin domain-containing protein [Sphingobacterium faecium]MDH5828163.1 fasciclin domain-containing protein [Sphingobacterium faecium]